MNPAIYIAILLPLLIIFMEENKKKRVIMNHIVKKKTEQEKEKMIEYIKSFIDKECYVYTINNTIKCTIKGVGDNAILLKTKNTTDVVNLDFVLRVSEIQKSKK